MEPFFFIYTTFASKEKACQIAKEMIQASYIACVNIFDNMTSIYIDADRMHEEKEVAVLMKTTLTSRDCALAYLAEKHPYKTPALLTWQAECNKPFEVWMKTRPKELGDGYEQ